LSFNLSKLSPPKAEARPHTSTHHGIVLKDNYAWLRADNWQDVMRDPEQLPLDIRAYLEAENSYYESAMSDTSNLQDELFEEMKGRVKQDDSSVPSLHGPYAYANRFEEGKEYPLFTRSPREGGDETVLFNGPKEAEGHEYFSVGMMSHTPDHSKMGWAVDTNGSEYYHMKIRDLATGKDGEDITNDVGSLAWCADSERFLYAKVDENHRPSKVLLKTQDGSETLVFEEEDPRFFVGVGTSLDGKYIQISTGQNDEDEVRILPSSDPQASPTLITPRRPGHEYSVDTHGETLYITTNSKDAENFRIVTCDLSAPSEDNWQELIPHRSDVLLVSVVVLKDYLIRLERHNALPRIVVRELSNGAEHTVDFSEEAYSLGIQSGYEFDTTNLRFTYSSPSTPTQVWDYNLSTRERVLRKEQEIPSGHKSDDYVVRRLHAPTDDGELVPLTVIVGG